MQLFREKFLIAAVYKCFRQVGNFQFHTFVVKRLVAGWLVFQAAAICAMIVRQNRDTVTAFFFIKAFDPEFCNQT